MAIVQPACVCICSKTLFSDTPLNIPFQIFLETDSFDLWLWVVAI